MTHTQTITPKKRINSIDALRGFALIGIMLLHCMERFDLTLAPVVESPFWQAIDTAVYDSLYFLFSGKSSSMYRVSLRRVRFAIIVFCVGEILFLMFCATEYADTITSFSFT